MKSGAGSVQARRLFAIFRPIEAAGREGRSADIRQHYSAAAAEFDEVCALFANGRPTRDIGDSGLEADRTDSNRRILDLGALEKDWSDLNLTSVVREIVDGFIAKAEVEIPELVEATAVNDFERTALLAHRLKSPARTLHAGTLADLLQEIENLSRGANPQRVRELAPKLSRPYAAVREKLSKFVDGQRN